MEHKTNHFNDPADTNRRNFVKQGLIISFSGFAGMSLLPGCEEKDKKENSEDKEVSPPEDLMQEPAY